MIHDVEEFGAELHVHLLPNSRILHDGKIKVAVSRTGNDIPARGAKTQRCIGHESCSVEPLLNAMWSGIRIGHEIRTIITQTGTAVILSSQNRERLSGLQGQDPPKLPAVAEGLGKPPRCGKVVNKAPAQPVTNVKIR